MNYSLVAPPRMVGEVELPASKSISNRALIINALCSQPGKIGNLADCDDTRAVASALASHSDHINVGAAGTAMRFLTAYFATRQGRTVTIDGSERMRQRPIGTLVEALRSLGAGIEYAAQPGFPPLQITGARLNGGEIVVDGGISSQYLSALMMIAPVIGGITLHVKGKLTSRPYVKMTATMMCQWGADLPTVESRSIAITAKCYEPRNFTVEADWSAAGYWIMLQALLPQSRITLRGLQCPSVQGDSLIANIAPQFGVIANRCGTYTDLCCTGRCANRIDEDLSDIPDQAQTLSVLLCLKGIPYRLSGLHTLRIKETDRIEALRSQLLKLGYVVEAGSDYLQWDGATVAAEANARIATFHDHRMAMAFAPAAVKFPGLVIEDATVVAKSYPQFWQHLRQMGFKLTEVE